MLGRQCHFTCERWTFHHHLKNKQERDGVITGHTDPSVGYMKHKGCCCCTVML